MIDTQELVVVAAPAPKAAASDRRPWPRYLARMLDTLVLGAVMGLILGIVLVFTTDDAGERVFAAMDGVGGTLLTNVVSFIVAAVPIAFLLAFKKGSGSLPSEARMSRLFAGPGNHNGVRFTYLKGAHVAPFCCAPLPHGTPHA